MEDQDQDLCNEVHVSKSEFIGYQKRTDESIEVLNIAVFGDRKNDRPGVVEAVRNINKALDVLVRLAWIVTTILMTALVTGIISVGTYLIKVMP